MKAILKYITLAILGVVMFVWVNRAALPERPGGGIGGEVVLLGLPLFWWLIERTAKDLLGEFKRMWNEIRGSDSADSGQKNNARTR